MKKWKGEFGYIKRLKRTSLLITAVTLVLLAAMLYIGRIRYQDNKNIFIALAAFLCLPAGKFLVNYLILYKKKECSDRAHGMLEAADRKLDHAYDLYITGEKINFVLHHVVIAGKTIAALTEEQDVPLREAESYILGIMENNGFHGGTLTIWQDPENYCAHIQEILESGRTGSSNGNNALRNLLFQISL